MAQDPEVVHQPIDIPMMVRIERTEKAVVVAEVVLALDLLNQGDALLGTDQAVVLALKTAMMRKENSLKCLSLASLRPAEEPILKITLPTEVNSKSLMWS